MVINIDDFDNGFVMSGLFDCIFFCCCFVADVVWKYEVSDCVFVIDVEKGVLVVLFVIW